MSAIISAFTLVVSDYDEAIDFYVGKLGFELREDVSLGDQKRWVKVAPKGAQSSLLLARADDASQRAAIGNQTGGRVALFLQTNNFAADYERYLANKVTFLEKPRFEAYGTVAVFRDPYGNLWDLIEPK